MSGSSDKKTRRIEEKKRRQHMQDAIKGLLKKPWYERAWFGWRITDQSPALRFGKWLFIIQYQKTWSFQLTLVPFSYHRPENRPVLNGWHIKLFWFAFDWRYGL